MNGSRELSLSGPPLRYHGSKWRLAPWVLRHFPPHRVYVEAFGGAAGVLLRKPPSPIEVYNDLDGDVVNFFRVLRDPRLCRRLCTVVARTAYARAEYDLAHHPSRSPVERARRLVVRAFMGFGSNAGTRRSRCGFRGADWSSRQANNLAWVHLPDRLAATSARLQGVVVEARPALDLLRAQDGPDTLFYLDPPYVRSTRSSVAKDHSYRHEMTDDDHRRLATAVRHLRGFVVLSGYRSPLYQELYGDWPTVETSALSQGNANRVKRREVIWLSPRTAAALPAAQLELA